LLGGEGERAPAQEKVEGKISDMEESKKGSEGKWRSRHDFAERLSPRRVESIQVEK